MASITQNNHKHYENQGPDITNPAYFGPGKWDTYHLEAWFARTNPEQNNFIIFLKRQIDNFPCVKCKNHAYEYLDNNPLENYLGKKSSTGEELGMFVWMWKFHNAVNTRLGKPVVEWDTAYSMYSGRGILVCGKGCDEAEKTAGGKSEDPKKTGREVTITRLMVPDLPKIPESILKRNQSEDKNQINRFLKTPTNENKPFRLISRQWS